MDVLESVHATRFLKRMTTGRNAPVLLEAERSNGEFIEVVVKFASAECGPGGLVREAVCSMLAADLGLPIAEPFVVEFSQDFIDSIPSEEEKKRLTAGSSGFGCRHAVGMHAYPTHQNLPPKLFDTAAGVFAFDGGVLNPDRLRIRPNCLTNGNDLLLIDHESALNVYGRGFLVIDPWTAGALKPLSQATTEHLFFKDLRGEQYDMAGLIDTLAALPTVRVDGYMTAVPNEWDADGAIRQDVAGYLKDLVSNAKSLSVEVGCTDGLRAAKHQADICSRGKPELWDSSTPNRQGRPILFYGVGKHMLDAGDGASNEAFR
jgi:hypothetical protein